MIMSSKIWDFMIVDRWFRGRNAIQLRNSTCSRSSRSSRSRIMNILTFCSTEIHTKIWL